MRDRSLPHLGTGQPMRTQQQLAALELLPPWLARDGLHRAYRSAPHQRMPDHYGPLFPDVEEDLPYVWPV